MTATNIITALTKLHPGHTCPTWVQQAAVLVHPGKYGRFYRTTAVNFFTEVTVRIEKTKIARRSGKLYAGLQRRRMDLIALVQAHYKKFEPFAMGIEIKVDEHDLMTDTKLTDYLDYCHLFYLAVPFDLKQPALAKLETLSNRGVGLILVGDTSPTFKAVQVVRAPEVRQPADTCLKDLYAELLIRPFKLGDYGSSCTFIHFEQKSPSESY